jgi:hypothetical protein
VNISLSVLRRKKFGIKNEKKKPHLKDKKAGRGSITGKPKLKG